MQGNKKLAAQRNLMMAGFVLFMSASVTGLMVQRGGGSGGAGATGEATVTGGGWARRAESPPGLQVER